MIRVLFYPGGKYAETGIGGGLLAMWQTARAVASLNTVELTIICEGNGGVNCKANVANFLSIPEARVVLAEPDSLEAQATALIENYHFDILHCMLPHTKGIIKKAKTRSIKVVYEVRHPTLFPMYVGDFIKQKSLKYLRYSRKLYADRSCARLADIAIAPSEWARNQMEARYGILPRRSRAFYNGIVNERTTSNSISNKDKARTRALRLLSIGRLENGKGFETLLEVFSKAHALRPEITLQIVGGGSLKDGLLKQIDRLDLSSSVRLTGILNGNEISEKYYNSDIYISCSENESFGNVVAEAMAAGVPVIAWAVGAIPEIAGDEKTAVLIPYKNQKAMVSELVLLIDDVARREQMAVAAQILSIKTFSWKKRAAMCYDTYREMLAS